MNNQNIESYINYHISKFDYVFKGYVELYKSVILRAIKDNDYEFFNGAMFTYICELTELNKEVILELLPTELKEMTND